MQIKPHQIPHFARQIERIKTALKECQFETYSSKGSMFSSRSQVEIKHLCKPIYAMAIHLPDWIKD